MVLPPSRLRARNPRICALPHLRGVSRANSSLCLSDSGPHTLVMSMQGGAGRVASPFAADQHGRRYEPVRLPHAHVENLGPSPLAGGTRETDGAVTAKPADDPAGLRSPHSLITRREWTTAARPPPPRPCTPLPRQGRRAPLAPLVPHPALHTPLRCLRALTARPHGASEHALHWSQGASRRRTRPAAATRST
eukprot:6209018-Pleurochrysis_carterae.AAC.1